MSEYENILHKIGSFGPFQRRVFILVSMFETPAAWAMLLPILLHATPDWECPDFGHSNTSAVNLSVATNSSSINECLPDGRQCPGLQFTGPFTSIVSEWQLVCNRKNLTKIIATIQMCGVFLGAFITGQLADIFGRRRVLYLAYLIMLIVSLGSAFSPFWQVFAALRFLIGGLVGGVMVVNFVLPLEFVTPSWRTFCGCVGFWAVGLMTLALWGFFLRDWRTLIIATALTGVPLLLSWRFVPESPRWLLSKGRFEEAKVLLMMMADYNNTTLSEEDFEQLHVYTKKEQESLIEKKRYSYLDLFKTRTMMKSTLIVMYGWFVSSSVYYGLNFNTNNLAGDLYINTFTAGLVEIPALIYVVLVNNRLGRRWTTASLMILAGIACFVILIVDLTGQMESMQVLVIVLAMVGKSGISGGWAAIQVSSAENFPTIVRNIGIGACSMAARIGGVVAPQINQLVSEDFSAPRVPVPLKFINQAMFCPWMRILRLGVTKNSYSKAMPFTVFGSLAFLCGLLVLFLPETAGKPLPDKLIPKRNVSQNTDMAASIENGHAPAEEEIPLNRL